MKFYNNKNIIILNKNAVASSSTYVHAVKLH